MPVRGSASLQSITEYFDELPDPRSEVNREHLLVEVIVISICAILAGADGPTAIAVWAKSPMVAAWLRQHLTLPNGIPSKDTYRRVLQRLRPAAFQQCFQTWLQSLVGVEGVRFLTVDGKTLRRSHDRKRQLGALHSVSVWATEQHLTLAQVMTAEKSNEITAIPQVLDLVDLQGAVVTIDAMGCQTAIAAQIVDGGGDYVLPVKGNQGLLEQAVTDFFTEHLEDDFARVPVSRLETTQTHHGRKETRSYFQVDVPPDLPGIQRWKGLRTLGLVVRTREIEGRETAEIQCSISSLKRNVRLFAKASRGHWGIENTCHWTLDMTFREDESRTRDRPLSENLAWLRRFALGLLKQHPDPKTSLVMKRRKAGWCLSFLAEVLFKSKS